jgi:aspartate racemase
MKRLGLIGGISAESTLYYYRALNAAGRTRRGPRHGLEHLIYSLDYGEVIALYDRGDWAGFRALFARTAQALKAAGAEAIVICSNTSHLAADACAEASGLPVLHLVDALAEAMTRQNVRRPLLLGTPVVMTGPFWRAQLRMRYDGEVLIPDAADQAETARIIFEELVEGVVLEGSREALHAIVRRATAAGADGVILGCTELCMILDQGALDTPVFDTTALHAAAAARFALGGA